MAFKTTYTHLHATNGVESIAVTGGPSLAAWTSSGINIEHSITNGAGNFDLTGGAYESLFTDTVNDIFTSADKGNWLVIRSGTYKNAMAEIGTYIDAENVLLHTMGWTFDISNVDYDIIQHPQFVIGDGHHNEFQVGTSGHFDIHSHDWVANSYSRYMFEAELESAADNVHCALLKAEAKGYDGVAGLHVDYESGNLGAGKLGGAIRSKLVMGEAVSADATTLVAAFIASLANGSSATSQAFVVLPGFDEALTIAGSQALNPGYGYEVTSGSVADRVNGGTADTTAFLSSSASNLALFDNDNDYILIGSDNTFEVIEWAASTGSAKDIDATFEYSTGNDTWSTLTVSDGTSGFQNAGQIIFTAPGGWAKGNEAESAADITSAYYVKITRTRTPSIATLPVEDYFKIYTSGTQGMKIRGDGSIQPATIADASASNDSIYYSSDQSKLVYKDSGGTVRDLY